jgi:SAM-dependent methyltransferase
LAPAEYDRLRRGHQGRRRREFVAGLIDARRDTRRVLEIGFGAGGLLCELAERYPGIEFSGVEPDERMRSYARAAFPRGNVRHLDGGPGDLVRATEPAFDLVYTVDVVHHVRDPLPFFRDVRAVMAKDGCWACLEPNIFHPWVFLSQERMRRAGLGEDHFRPSRMEPLWKEAGFRVARRGFLLAYPSFVRGVGRPLAALERVLEKVRFLAGSVWYVLTPTGR